MYNTTIKYQKTMKLELADGITMSFSEITNVEDIKKVGIANLKEVAKFSIRFRNKVVKYQKDGHIDWFERFGLGVSLIGAVKLALLWDLIKAEIADLDKQEWEELLVIVAEGFGADSELAKEYFGDFIDFIDGLKGFFAKQKK